MPEQVQIRLPRGISPGQELELRKEKIPERVKHELWLVITLLVAFFTTMYAMSTVDLQKSGRIVTSMKASQASPAR